MDIGDKIRLVRDKEEGVIRRKLSNNVFEVELTDGFDIQVHFSEITLLQKAEQGKNFEERKDAPSAISKNVVSEIDSPVGSESMTSKMTSNSKYANDVYFVLEVKNNECFTFLFNRTSKTLQVAVEYVIGKELVPYGLFEVASGEFLKMKTLKKEFLNKKTCVRLYYTLFDERSGVERLPEINYKLDMNLIMSEPLPLNELGIEYGYVFPNNEQVSINPSQLKEQLMSGISSPQLPQTIQGGEAEIDLHLESLVGNPESISESERLKFQLEQFEKFLDKCISKGVDQIVIIHGVGAGKLRTEIHKKLSEHTNVAWYKDANKTKFGYGATKAKLI